MAEDAPTIRAATPEDLEALSAMMAGSYALLSDSRYDALQLAAALPVMSAANPKLLASGTYYVAEVDGVPAACGGWTVSRPGTGEVEDGVAHIRHFATHPDYLRRGLARLLLDRCLSEATVAGIRLMKSQSTLPAESFYAGAGFVPVGMIKVELAKDVTLPGIDMQKALP